MKTVNLFLFICFLVFSRVILSQEFSNSIRGKVTDAKTGEPLINANVFISETLWGSTTDNNGNYEIMSINPGKHELVISILGYEVKIKGFNIKKNQRLSFDFKLNPKSYELDEIVVDTERPKEWYKNLKLFKELFLGKSEFTKDCIIENELYLNFSHGSNSRNLYAETSRPLIVKNYALGFKIESILLSFSYIGGTTNLKYLIKPKYSLMEPEDENQKREWEKNRAIAYYGSMNHLLSSLVNRKSNEEGYMILLSSEINTDKNRPIMGGKMPTKKDSLLRPGMLKGETIMKFKDYLYVNYFNELSDKQLISYLKLNYEDVTIDKYGYTQEAIPFICIGHFAKTGMANILPKYYKP